MKTKRVLATVKAAGPDDGLQDGQFIAYASVFGNVDSYGDVVMPGAFTDTLAEWRKSGDVLPLLWGHDFYDPFSNIGGVVTAEEDGHGLKVTAQLDLENAKAAQVYRLMKGRRVNQMSFAYDVLEGGWEKTEELGEYYALRKLKIHEVSVVPLGANQETEILAVKGALEALAAQAEAGQLAKGLIDSLRDAQEAISAVIKAADGTDQEQASGTPEAKSGASDEEPSGAKSSVPDEEPKADPSVENWAHTLSLLALGNE